MRNTNLTLAELESFSKQAAALSGIDLYNIHTSKSIQIHNRQTLGARRYTSNPFPSRQ